MNGRKDKKSKALIIIVVVIIAIVAVASTWVFLGEDILKNVYPTSYSEYVHKYSSKYGLDEKLVYAFIKTESGFDEKAESALGARGLMQIMPATFEWIRYRLFEDDDKTMSFDRMFEPKENIRYGCYLLRFLSDSFAGGITEMAAAYHAGYNIVLEWTENPQYSTEGKLTDIPYGDTAHYVEKINSAYKIYCRLYK